MTVTFVFPLGKCNAKKRSVWRTFTLADLCGIVLLLLLYLAFRQLTTNQQCNNDFNYLMVEAGYDIKHFPGRNDGLKKSRYIDSDNGPTSMKLLTFLNLTQLALFASTAFLLSGDICPQPGSLSHVTWTLMYHRSTSKPRACP